MSTFWAVGDRLRAKARGARRRFVEGLLSLRPVRLALHRRATAAWRDSNSIVFVCLGNICRSPFAEAIARLRLAREDVASAGTFPRAGRRSPDAAIAVARLWSVDLAPHRSRVFDEAALHEGAAVFVFDVDNLIRMWRRHPSSRARVHLLGALSPEGPLVIPDPYGRTTDEFERTYARIAQLISRAERDGRRPVR